MSSTAAALNSRPASAAEAKAATGSGDTSSSLPPHFDPRAFVRSDRLSPADAQRHTKLVRYLRAIIPAAGAALLATYAFSATPPQIDRGFLNNFTRTDVEDASMRLDRPRYAGEDLRGLPFEISAKSAGRDPNAPELVDLENPEALRSVANQDGTDAVAVSAKSGLLNTSKKKIDLSDTVQLQHSLGGAPIIFNTDAASVDLEQNTVTSTVGVTADGERGSLAADNVTVFQGEGRAVLEGNVRLTIKPKTKEDKPEGGLR